MKFDDYLKEQLKDPEFRKEYEALKPEMDRIRAMIDAGKSADLVEEETDC